VPTEDVAASVDAGGSTLANSLDVMRSTKKEKEDQLETDMVNCT
jgi:hypothetical protein